MVTAWLNSSIGSLTLVLVLAGFIIGFGILMAALISWIGRIDRTAAHYPPASETPKKPPLRKAA